jgi:putative selenate reductase
MCGDAGLRHEKPAMAELIPVPFDVLASRLFGELAARQSAFGLAAKRFFAGSERDLSVAVHGRRAATPFGPAAGPHTQLAQNIVSSWLAGGRVIELKTVQVKDALVVPRPCIDMQTVGFNVEWSQELKLEQSLDEYVKASMLIDMLTASGHAKAFDDTIFDMSVGYDLAGIRSDRVRAFMAAMMNANAVVTRLREQLPRAFGRLRDLPFATRISDTVTLSTFHGCPPDEIEAIAAFLMREVGLHVTVKLNPTLLGREEVDEVLHARLGYDDIRVPDAAFAKDVGWDQMAAFIDRLGRLAESLGRSFGVKFSNTLIVDNHKTFFPASQKEMYLSGPPLHVVAMLLVRRFRRAFGDRFPISFSGGIDAGNFADAVALGLKPITVCSDMLKSGANAGYARGSRYLGELVKRMDAVGAASVDEFVVKAYGHGGDVSAARLANTEVYVERLLAEPRYGAAQNAKLPKKVGSRLALFDCLTCDKCIPVCPNGASLTLPISPREIAVGRLVPHAGGFVTESAPPLILKKPWQIGVFADACNECGNCDTFCPEDGRPSAAKPLLFGSLAAWKAASRFDGFAFERTPGGIRVHARIDGATVSAERTGSRVRYRGEGFDLDLDLDPADPAASAVGHAEAPVDLAPLRIMEVIRDAVIDRDHFNFISVAMGDLEALTPGAAED